MATNFTDAEIEAQRQAVEETTKGRLVKLELEVSEKALRTVRAGFNPSKLGEVGQIHLLAAAFITICEKMQKRQLPGVQLSDGTPHAANVELATNLIEARRQAALAITHIETASMFAVKAVTAEVYAAGRK